MYTIGVLVHGYRLVRLIPIAIEQDSDIAKGTRAQAAAWMKLLLYSRHNTSQYIYICALELAHSENPKRNTLQQICKFCEHISDHGIS